MKMSEALRTMVYKDLIISTIVDLYKQLNKNFESIRT